MPIKLSVETYGKKDVFAFDPRDLVKNFAAYTGRHERTEQQINDMVQSLLVEGQLQPFLYRKGEKGQPIPVSGHTRILAALRIIERKLQDKDVTKPAYGPKNPFLVYGMLRPNIDALEALLLTFRENSDDTRTPPNDLDVAYLIKELSEVHQLKDVEIAQRMRRPASYVSKHRRLLGLDDEHQAQVRQGEMRFDTALAVTDVAAKDRKRVVEKAKEATGGKITAASVKTAARELGAETAGKTATARTDAEWKKWLAVQSTNTGFHGDGRLVKVYRGILAWREGSIDDVELRDRFAELEAGPKVEAPKWDGDNRGHGLLVSALRLRKQGAEFADLCDYVRILNRVRCSPELSSKECREIAEKAVQGPAAEEAA